MAENKDYITRQDEQGSINISEEVIGIIAVEAIGQVEGVGGIANTLSKDIAEFLGKKSAVKGVRIHVDNTDIRIDAYIAVKYGYAIHEVALQVQTAIADAVTDMTGLPVAAVNVHVSGVVFEKN